MKFSTYSPAVRPNTIGAHVTSTANAAAYGAAESARNYGMLADAAGRLAVNIKKQQDESDAADIMEARTEITRRINESLYGEQGIVTTGKGKNAEGMTDRIGQSVEDITNEVAGNYNGRVRYQLTRKYLPQDQMSYGKTGMMAENRERENYRTGAYNAKLASDIDYLSINYRDQDLVKNRLLESDEAINTRAMTEGWDGTATEQARTAFKTKAVAGMVNAAMAEDDFAAAGNILKDYRRDMDPDAYYSLYNTVKKNQRTRENYAMGQDMFQKYWDPTTHTFDGRSFQQELNTLYGRNSRRRIGGIDTAETDRAIDRSGLIGSAMPSGANGCVEAYTRLGSFVSPWLREQQGQVNVDKILEAAQEEGGPGVIDFDPGQVEYGDGIVYVDKNGDTQHIVMAAGKSPGDRSYIGNSSSRLQIVRGEDYGEMDGLTPAKIIKTGAAAGGEERSNYSPEQMAAITRTVESLYANEIKIRRNKQNELADIYLNRIVDGDTSTELQQEIRGSALDPEKKLALLSRIRTENKRLISGSFSGSVTDEKIERARKAIMRYEDLLDKGKTPSRVAQYEADKASKFLIDNGLMEGTGDLDNQEIWSYITDRLDRGVKIEEIEKSMIENGASPEMARWYVQQIDVDYQDVE